LNLNALSHMYFANIFPHFVHFKIYFNFIFWHWVIHDHSLKDLRGNTVAYLLFMNYSNRITLHRSKYSCQDFRDRERKREFSRKKFFAIIKKCACIFYSIHVNFMHTYSSCGFFYLTANCNSLAISLHTVVFINSFFFFFLQYWGLNSGPSPWATPSAQFFLIAFFEIGSRELFAQAGFELRSSWCLPPE
jgi:hypothetical protein